jgi:hypothetical protein
MNYAITSLNVMPQDLSKMSFDGNNYKRLKEKIEFLLTTMKVYVLDTPCLVVPADGATDEQTDVKFKWEEDNYTCRGISSTPSLILCSTCMHQRIMQGKSGRRWRTKKIKKKIEDSGK